MLAIVVLLTIGELIAFGQKTDPPKTVANNFYAQLFYLRIRGLPDTDQMKAISPFLSSGVRALILRDQTKQTVFIKKHPDEKPPWIEGDLFSSLFEGTTAFRIGNVRKRGSTTEVDVQLEYLADGQDTKWTDTAVLKQFGGKWLITNIIYEGRWQFKTGTSLLNALK